jgi:plasmid stabilization system protein ParE
MYTVYITDIAEEEMLTTAKYIADVLKTPMAANDLLDEIVKCENTLETTPNIFSFVPDKYLRAKGMKYIMINNYMVFYIINEDEKAIDVIRFLYSRRDWKRILNSYH